MRPSPLALLIGVLLLTAPAVVAQETGPIPVFRSDIKAPILFSATTDDDTDPDDEETPPTEPEDEDPPPPGPTIVAPDLTLPSDLGKWRQGTQKSIEIPLTGTIDAAATVSLTGLSGMAYDPLAELLFGTPLGQGNASWSLTVANSAGQDVISSVVSIQPILTVSVPSSTAVTSGNPVSVVPTPAGLAGAPYWWGTNVPAGLSVNPGTGAVTGSISTASTYGGIVLHVRDAWDDAEASSNPFEIVIAPLSMTALADAYNAILVHMDASMDMMRSANVSFATDVVTWMATKNRIPPGATYDVAADRLEGPNSRRLTAGRNASFNTVYIASLTKAECEAIVARVSPNWLKIAGTDYYAPYNKTTAASKCAANITIQLHYSA